MAEAAAAGTRTRPAGASPHLLLSSFVALLERDVRVQLRSLGQFVARVVLQPLLITFVFAYLLPRLGQPLSPGARSSLGTVLVPGLMAVSIFSTGISALALPLSLEYLRHEMVDRLLAPLPVPAIAVEKIVVGSVQGLLAAVIVFPIAYLVPAASVSVQVTDWWLLAAVMAMACLTSSALGVALGCLMRPDQFGLLFGVILGPLMFLGCVYYPWGLLYHVPWLQVAVLANPLVYMSEGLRGALTPSVPHMPAWAFLGGLAVWLVLSSLTALRLFVRRATS